MRAKILNETEVERTLAICRPQEAVMVLLSHKAGLRAMEIAALDWRMVLDASGAVADALDLPAMATKGKTGAGRVPMAPELKVALIKLAAIQRFPRKGNVIRAPKGAGFAAHSVAQKLKRLYAKAGLDASSHSGRRTFATRLASHKGLNAFQVQRAMRHSDIAATRPYVDDAASDLAVVAAITG